MKTLNYFLLIFLLSNVAFAQKPFTGTIVYNIIYASDDMDEELQSQMPQELKVTYGKYKTRTVLNTKLGQSIIIADKETESTVVLLEIKGKKFAVKNSKQFRNELIQEIPETLIKFTEEKKDIAGYSCKKAELLQGPNTLIAYYSEDITIPEANWYNQFKNIPGVMLEYTQITDELETRYKAKAINEHKTKKKAFEIPADFAVISQEQLDEILQKEFITE